MGFEEYKPFPERLAAFQQRPDARRQWLHVAIMTVLLTAAVVALFVVAARTDRSDLVGLAILLIPAAGFFAAISWRMRSVVSTSKPPTDPADQADPR